MESNQSAQQSPDNAAGAPRTDRKHRQASSLVILLISLVFILFVVPILGHTKLGTALLRVGITAVLISAAVATRRAKVVLFLGLFVAAVAAPVSWMTMFIDQPVFFLFSCVLEGAFFVAMALMIVQTVMKRYMATIHSIFGAISAYLLLGLGWAVIYWGIDHLDDSAMIMQNRRLNSVVVAERSEEVADFSQFVYFSFVTMSTLGYGDIQPVSPPAQTLAWMQSVAGQFYMAVLVAWMVSEIPTSSRQQAGRDS